MIEVVLISFITKSVQVSGFLRWYCYAFFNKNYKSKVKSINKCIISGRSKSVYRFAQISRIFLRENAFINKLPGLKKSYW